MNETCVYEVAGEGRCWRPVEAYGYCRVHVAYAPEEQAAYEILVSRIQLARARLDEIGEQILKSYVLFADDPVPEDLKRDYRNAWYRHNYLVSIRNNRRPGAPLPAEVVMKPE